MDEGHHTLREEARSQRHSRQAPRHQGGDKQGAKQEQQDKAQHAASRERPGPSTEYQACRCRADGLYHDGDDLADVIVGGFHNVAV